MQRPLELAQTPARIPLPRGAWLRRAYAANRPLTLVGLSSVAMMLIALVGLVVDPATITGAPGWLKPLKFAVSIAIYAFTLLAFLGAVRGHARLVALVSWGTALGLLAETILIAMQVVRGITSHFNVATPLDQFVFERMRDFIIVVFTMGLLAAGLLLCQRLPDRALAASLRWGIALAVVGMAIAILMTVPTPLTQAAFAGTQAGAHSVGVADGGPGLPIVGWSTVGGDLRVPHFVGLHALQFLPLLWWALARRRFDALGAGGRVALVRIAGAGYLGLLGLLTWQALRGQPLVAPDALTVAAAGALAGAVALATAVTVIIARRAAR